MLPPDELAARLDNHIEDTRPDWAGVAVAIAKASTTKENDRACSYVDDIRNAVGPFEDLLKDEA